jgi:hypothetical protein
VGPATCFGLHALREAPLAPFGVYQKPNRGLVRIPAVRRQGQASRIAYWRHSFAGVVAVLRIEASQFEEELPAFAPECAQDLRRATEALDRVAERLKQVEDLESEHRP